MDYSLSPRKHYYLQVADDERDTESQTVTWVILAYKLSLWSKYKALDYARENKSKEPERPIFLSSLFGSP